MKKEKEKRIAVLKSKILELYKEYYKDNTEIYNYFELSKKNNKSNKFLQQIEKDTKRFLGENNSVGWETIGKILLENHLTPQDTIVDKLESYCKRVQELLEIRELKNKVLSKTKFTNCNSEDFVEFLDLELKEISKSENLSKHQLNLLFLENDKEYEVSDSTIEILQNYISQEKEKPNSKRKKILVSISLTIIVLATIFFIDKEKSSNEQTLSSELPPYKIMIVPFDQEISYEGSMQNIGSIIEKRLLELNKTDSLGIQVLYKANFKPDRKFEDATWEDYYRRVMKENEVDHIIYGATREERNSSDESDKICLNYIINNDYDFLNSDTKYIFHNTSIKQITKGKLQENIDFLVYLNAALTNIHSNRDKSLRLIDKILNHKNISKTAYLEAIKIRLFSFFIKMNFTNNFQITRSMHDDIKYVLENDKKGLYNELFFNLKLLIGDKSVIREIDSLIKNKIDIPFLYTSKFLSTMYFNDSISEQDVNNVIIKAHNNKEKEFVLVAASRFYTFNSDYKKVLKYCNLGLSNFESIDLKYYRGLAYKNLRDFDDAINDFNFVIEKKINEVHSHVEIGLIYLIKNDFIIAENSFKKALINCNDTDLKNEILNHIFSLYADYNLASAGLKFYTSLNVRKENNREAKILILLARKYFKYQLGDFENGKLDSVSVLKIDNRYFIKQDSIYKREKEIIDSIRKVERKNMFKEEMKFIKRNYN